MISKPFKYQEFLDKFKNCPPSTYKEVEMTAFRWVFETCDEECFKPVLILKPSRTFNSDVLNCTAYALSLFAEKNEALKRYSQFVHKRPKLKDDLGTKITEIEIEKSDGICSEPERNNFSHFIFHEYLKTDLSKKVVNIAEIIQENGNIEG